MISFLPKEEKYFEHFNRIAANVVECAEVLKKLFNDFEHHHAYADQIHRIEHTCDELIHDIMRQLHQTFITPIDREDIYGIAAALDDIVDCMDYVARRTVLYRVDSTTDHAKAMADVLVRITESVRRAIALLGKGSEGIMKECNVIHTLETEGDTWHHEAVDHLFTKETDPIRVIKWKELYEMLEKSIDKCDDVANVLEAVALKNA